MLSSVLKPFRVDLDQWIHFIENRGEQVDTPRPAALGRGFSISHRTRMADLSEDWAFRCLLPDQWWLMLFLCLSVPEIYKDNSHNVLFCFLLAPLLSVSNLGENRSYFSPTWQESSPMIENLNRTSLNYFSREKTGSFHRSPFGLRVRHSLEKYNDVTRPCSLRCLFGTWNAIRRLSLLDNLSVGVVKFSTVHFKV